MILIDASNAQRGGCISKTRALEGIAIER
jgi:hypothetical protein